ncbi:response regulator [Psychromonas sp.]|uniref:response regulator n=1 Tax=Psychromonas sp. TaxID=1884585 RepID=UPI003A98721E
METHANKHILIVDDDMELASLVAEFLQTNGFSTQIETNGRKAAQRIIEEQPLLVVLDIMLPDLDGLSVCRYVRYGHPDVQGTYSGPIIMLTALDNDIDEVAGLETGADDYLAKPVRSRVLLARIRVLLRRDEHKHTQPSAPISTAVENNQSSLIKFDNLEIDTKYQTVKKHGHEIDLTTAEFELLALLASSPGVIRDREFISTHFSKLGYESTNRTIDLRVSRIRKKLGDDDTPSTRIRTVHGKGYLFVGDR